MAQETNSSGRQSDVARRQVFNNPQFGKLRVVEKDNQPWFVAKDVCVALDISNVTVALQRLDDDERSKFNLGRQGDVNVVNEYGLYSLILVSRKPEAKQFKRWITHEVLPSIRKEGGYIATKQGDTEDDIMARALLIAQNRITQLKDRNNTLQCACDDYEKKRIAANKQIEALKPDAEYTRETLTSNSTWNTNVVAKEFGMSAITLNQRLKQIGIQYKQHGVWMLTAKYQNKGYTKTSTYKYVNQDGTIGTRIQMEWTEAGRKWLHDLRRQGRF